MEIVIHLPRNSEAELIPNPGQDLVVKPKFYRRNGTVPAFYFSVRDAKGNEDRHVMTINGQTKKLLIEHLVEVSPACDDEKRAKEKKEVVEFQVEFQDATPDIPEGEPNQE